ncbi:MAG TPA: class I SAM-dependent methyltransferase [bacterium]|nr:class I SAM-dependent methyltransferase [bacterium]
MPKQPPKDAWDGQLETLDDLSGAVHYNRWIYGMMEPFLGRKVLEVGCGIGNLTEFLAEGREVLAVDLQDSYLNLARKRLGSRRSVHFQRVNLEKKLPFFQKFRPDTIVSSNVLEHIREDRGFIRECYQRLPRGGRFLNFVPAMPSIYGSMDRHYGHFRRYTLGDLDGKMRDEGFEVLQSRYLNLLGIFGWWLNGRVLKKTIVPKGQILLYDKILRWVVPIEKWLPRPIGLSLFCAAIKK